MGLAGHQALLGFLAFADFAHQRDHPRIAVGNDVLEVDLDGHVAAVGPAQPPFEELRAFVDGALQPGHRLVVVAAAMRCADVAHPHLAQLFHAKAGQVGGHPVGVEDGAGLLVVDEDRVVGVIEDVLVVRRHVHVIFPGAHPCQDR